MGRMVELSREKIISFCDSSNSADWWNDFFGNLNQQAEAEIRAEQGEEG